MKNITDIQSHFTDDENYTHIDVWVNNEENGNTVAIVCRDTKKVYFIDNTLRNDTKVIEEIKKALKGIKKKKRHIRIRQRPNSEYITVTLFVGNEERQKIFYPRTDGEMEVEIKLSQKDIA